MMNKDCYSIAHNQTPGQLLTKTKTISAQVKRALHTCAKSTPARQALHLVFCFMLTLGAQLPLTQKANAQVVAYRNAPTNQQPTIHNAANGVPLVNIQTPSSAGVSRNTYSQFDVEQQGAILNNSRSNVQTQLGGWVQGNPWLATGTARVILNEVISANPSQLGGYVEVAGDRAQVVIANPAGVTCSGCGFINASRATITTGTPIINGGNLEGYRVEGGNIRIEGAGMDSSSADYTDLIARSVEVNAGLWANTLKVSTGTNQVNADNTTVTPIAASGSVPTFALDVAALGGMYAGKITMVGTESGVGVRNAGKIGSSVGEVVITADGRLLNSGSIISSTQTQINTSGDIINSGVAYAKGTASITTQGKLDNTLGTLAAKGNVDLIAVSIDNTQGLIGSESGKVVADASAGTLINHTGQIEAAQGITLTSSGLTNTDGTIVGQNLSLNTRLQALDNTGGAIAATGTLNLQSGAITNDAGLIQSTEALTINSNGQSLTNTNAGITGGIIGQSSVVLTTGNLDNTAGFIDAKGALTIDSASITNTSDANLTSEQDITITGASLDNQGGQIQALGSANVQVTGAINNTGSLIRTGQGLSLTANSVNNSNTQGIDQGVEGQSLTINANQIDNTSGALRADQILTLTSGGNIYNSNGLISSAHTVQILDPNALPASNEPGKTLAMTNTGGTMIADQQLSIDSASLSGDGALLSLGDIDIKLLTDFAHGGPSAFFAANGNTTLETTGTLTNQARMQAGNNITLKAGTINNDATGEIVANSVSLNATDTNTLTNRGLIDGGDTFIDSATVENLGTGRIYGDHLAITATTLTNEAETVNGVTSAPVIAARTRLDIGATTINNREGAIIFSTGDMYIGGSLDGDHHATGKVGTLNNNSASIEALGNLTLNAGQINNTNEHVSTQFVPVSSEGIDEYVVGGNYYRPDEVYITWEKTGAQMHYPPATDGMGWMGSQGFFSDNSDNYIYLHTPGNSATRYFWLYSYTRSTSETQLLTSAPGKITSGGSMQIEADQLNNRDSNIIAGGNLVGTIGALNNIGTQGERIVSDRGTAWYVFKDGDHDDSDRDAYGYNPAPSATDFTLVSSRYEGNTAPDGSGTSLSELSVGSVTQVAAGADDAGSVIRTITPGTTLPGNSLFQSNPNPTSNYLIETDPRFASYRNWLTSDYMLQALGLNPASTQKRLGDGFYEQQLINEQVAQLTGRRFLEGYASNEEQYRALMDAGVTYAQNLQLIPGVALSAAQMAALTSDIIWLVEKEVALADGSTQKVLVPQLYARLRAGDLLPSGTLLAANNIELNLSGDLINSGSIAGRQIVALTAENIKNLGGRISGQQTHVAARNDLSNIGGVIEAQERLIASAGHNLTIASTTSTQENAQGSRTSIDRVAGLYVTGENGVLVASAGNDLSILASVINNAAPTASGNTGSTVLVAGNNLNLATVNTAYSEALGSGNHKRQESGSSEVGTVIQTNGDLTLLANNDISAQAASVTSSEGTLTVQAGNDIRIEAGESRLNVAEQHKYKKKGFLSSKKTKISTTLNNSSAIASTFSGDSTTLIAGQDVQIKGSNLVATNDTTLLATRDIDSPG